MKHLKHNLSLLVLAISLAASSSFAGAWHGKKDLEAGLTGADTNNWDVSSGTGGGITTNDWGLLHYGSNEFQSLVKDTYNDCIFSEEIADFGESVIPLLVVLHFWMQVGGD